MKVLFFLAATILLGCNVELPTGDAPKGTVSPSPKRDQGNSKFAMVSTPGFPGACLPGIVRADPWGEQLATIPSGTLVWVGESKLALDPVSRINKRWYRVRFYQEGAPISGWMHAGILRSCGPAGGACFQPPVWKEAEPINADTFE